jgi:hypothetical protein
MKTPYLLAALSALIPSVAFSGTVHNVWANGQGGVSEPGANYTAATTDCSFVWNESTTSAFAIARVKTTLGDVFEFQLAYVTSNTTAYEINGLWHVTKNGVQVCTNCAGKAYGLTGQIGNGFKFSGSGYGMHAGITNRYSF